MNTITIDQSRLARITTLKPGHHSLGSEEMCFMEAVAYVADDNWSEYPGCSCPVIGEFIAVWNNTLPSDEDRTRLLVPLIPKIICTRSTKSVERRRAMMAADWLVRTHTGAWLRLAKLNNHADVLASLPDFTDFKNCSSWMLRGLLHGAAAWAAVQPAVADLQQSSIALVERMIAVESSA